VLVVLLVRDLEAGRGLRIDVRVEASEDQRLIKWMLDVGRLTGECTTGAEEHDVTLIDLLDRCEVEELVLLERAAGCEAELMAREVVVLLEIERALRTERCIAEEAEDRAVHVVRARLRHARQRTAGRTADLRVEAIVDDAELAHCILAEARTRETIHLVGHVDAVDEDRRLGCVAARADHRPAVDETEAAALALDARRDERELLEVAIHRRQLL